MHERAAQQGFLRTVLALLAASGDNLAQLAQGIGNVDGGYLNVVIAPWLAEKLKIAVGSLVVVDNKWQVQHDPQLE